MLVQNYLAHVFLFCFYISQTKYKGFLNFQYVMSAEISDENQENKEYIIKNLEEIYRIESTLEKNVRKIVATHEYIPLDFKNFVNMNANKKIIFSGLEKFEQSHYCQPFLEYASLQFLIELARLDDLKEKIGDIIKNTYKFNNCTGDGCIFLLKSGFSYNTLNYTADKLFEFLLKRFIQRIYVQFIEDFKYYNIFIFLFSHLIIDQIRKRIEHEKYSFGLAYLTRPIRNFVVYNLLNPNAGRTDMQIKILIDYMKNIELYFAQIMKNYKEKDIILFRVSFKIAYAPFEFKKNLLSTYEDNKDVYLLEKLFSALHSYQFDYSKKYICEKK